MNVSMQQLLDRMQATEDKIEYMKLQSMYQFKIEKKKAKDVAASVGTTKGMIYQWAYIYKNKGIQGFINKPRGGRVWAFMTLEEERELLENLKNDATKGLVVISKMVRKKAEEKLGKPVSADYAEDLLNRHGWRKIAPRPKHPKSSKKEQEEFKKKCQTLSTKLQSRLIPQMKDL